MPPPPASPESTAFTRAHRNYLARVEAGIDTWLPAADARPPRLHQAMRYAVSAGGKRLRPVLLLAFYDLYPSEVDPLPAAVALECLHTYSLVHDDLPCMDDSDLRRGRLTCHREFDEVTALLAGDALLTESFRILGQAYGDEPVRCTALVRELADAAGSCKLIAGQVEDTLGEGQILDANAVHFIHSNKTAALFSAALAMGVHLSEAPPKCLGRAREIGNKIGLAFQIVDDILDATGRAEIVGKATGADHARGKNTAVSIHGLDAARAFARQLSREARESCAAWDADTTFLTTLIRSLEDRIR